MQVGWEKCQIQRGKQPDLAHKPRVDTLVQRGMALLNNLYSLSPIRFECWSSSQISNCIIPLKFRWNSTPCPFPYQRVEISYKIQPLQRRTDVLISFQLPELSYVIFFNPPCSGWQVLLICCFYSCGCFFWAYR